MRVVLSTIGKFHTFDLARQMHNRGALRSVYTGYPWFKLKNEGLPRQAVKTFPYLHAPYMRFAPQTTWARQAWEWYDRVSFDRFVAGGLPPCDVFCGLSGSALFTSRTAKSLGAKYVCDRGSSHIRFQDRILREEYQRQGLPFAGIDPRIIQREESEYEAADVITVPSTFAFNTFVENGVPIQKLRLVPYGVDLSAFYPCAKRDDSEFRVLFVGAMCVRKGVSYLLEAFQRLQCSSKCLTLVGAVLPESQGAIKEAADRARISVLGPVPQQQLKKLMSASHAMVLPSVEEGLALVQAQAMACGCAVIASQNTGAEDLFTDGKEGFIVPIRDAKAIADRLQLLADSRSLQARMSEAALERVKAMGGWRQYGDRMYEVFSQAIAS